MNKWKLRQMTAKDFIDFCLLFVLFPLANMTLAQLKNCQESKYNVLRCPEHAKKLLEFMEAGLYVVRRACMVVEGTYEVLCGRHSSWAGQRLAATNPDKWLALGFQVKFSLS